MKLRVIRVDLPLKHVFTTSRSSVSIVRTIIVELEQDGLRGHGEVHEDPYYGIDVEGMTKLIEQCHELLPRYALADPIAFWNHLDPILGKNKFAQSAVDCAACDLWGKMKNKPLWKIWGLSRENVPISSYNVGIDSVERIMEQMADNFDWPAYRVKIGDRGDMDMLRAIRQRTNAPFRLDVNGAWNVDTAMRHIEIFKGLNVELIEQPLAPDDDEGMTKLRKEMKKKGYTVPLFADESWRTPDDLDRLVKQFDGVNIKLAKCGGLTPARQLVAKAKYLGYQLLAANSVESTVGMSAIAQLASQFDYLGVDGPVQIDKRIGNGVRVDKGRLIFPDENGTSVRVAFR